MNEIVRAATVATWAISLDVTCPKCEAGFDLVDIDLVDIFKEIASTIEPLETGTDRTKNYETECPECEHEFGVCFAY